MVEKCIFTLSSTDGSGDDTVSDVFDDGFVF